MQEKTTNIEMTSMEASSSSTTRPPQERPSGDSHDGQKKNGSGPSSGLIRSSSLPSHFGEFSTSHLSAFTNTGPGTVLPNEADRRDRRSHGNQQVPYDGIQEEVLLDDDYSRIHGNQQEPYHEIQEEADHPSPVINSNLQRLFQEIKELDEQGLLDYDNDKECCSPGCYLLCSVPVFISLFLLVSLILYNVSKHQKPVITMKSITFDQFTVSLGSDLAGLETYMASVNSTVKFTYRNTATLFRVRVTMSKPLNLNYLELTLATGNINDFYQSKKSQRTVAVQVTGNQIPMYGAAESFISYGGKPVPLNLGFAVHSRGYVLGSLVKPQFNRNIYCSVIFDPKKLKVPLSLHNCTHK